MTKRLVSAAGSLAAIGAVALATAPGAMAANGGACQIQGNANFSVPLTAGPAASPFAYTFNGTLSHCVGTGPSGGSIFTPDPVTNASGSCVNSTTSGVAVVQWTGGGTTVESYTTRGAAAAVLVTGSVIPSYKAGNGTTYTTDTFAGDSAGGQLAFTPASPTDCQSGVTTAAINGVVETGGTA